MPLSPADNPYGVDITEVHDLVPYNTLDDGSADHPGTVRVTTPMVERWIREYSAAVTSALEVIPAANLTDARRTQFAGLACTAIINRVAARWDAAVRPDNLDYSTYLRDEWTSGMGALQALIDRWVGQGSGTPGDDEGADPGTPGSVYGSFQPPLIRDTQQW